MYVVWTGFVGSVSVAGCSEQGNEASGPIESEEFADHLSDFHFLGLLPAGLPNNQQNDCLLGQLLHLPAYYHIFSLFFGRNFHRTEDKGSNTSKS